MSEGGEDVSEAASRANVDIQEALQLGRRRSSAAQLIGVRMQPAVDEVLAAPAPVYEDRETIGMQTADFLSQFYGDLLRDAVTDEEHQRSAILSTEPAGRVRILREANTQFQQKYMLDEMVAEREQRESVVGEWEAVERRAIVSENARVLFRNLLSAGTSDGETSCRLELEGTEARLRVQLRDRRDSALRMRLAKEWEAERTAEAQWRRALTLSTRYGVNDVVEREATRRAVLEAKERVAVVEELSATIIDRRSMLEAQQKRLKRARQERLVCLPEEEEVSRRALRRAERAGKLQLRGWRRRDVIATAEEAGRCELEREAIDFFWSIGETLRQVDANAQRGEFIVRRAVELAMCAVTTAEPTIITRAAEQSAAELVSSPSPAKVLLRGIPRDGPPCRSPPSLDIHQYARAAV